MLFPRLFRAHAASQPDSGHLPLLKTIRAAFSAMLIFFIMTGAFTAPLAAQPEDIPEDVQQDWAEMEAELQRAQQNNDVEVNEAAQQARDRAAEIARRRAEARRRAAARSNNSADDNDDPGDQGPEPPERPGRGPRNNGNQPAEQAKEPQIEVMRGQQAGPQTVRTSDTKLELITDEPEAETAGADPKANIRLQYQDAPIGTIVRALSDKLGKPILGDYNVEGTVTFYDSRLYTLREAFDTVNILLAMHNYRLIEDGRFLRLIQLDDLAGVELPILSGLKDAEGLSDQQLVTVLLPLKYIQAEEASKLFVTMVSSYGSIAPMAKSKSILITDRLGNINRINRLLQLIDTEATSEDSQMRIVELKYARASDVASVIDNLWGPNAAPRRTVYDQRRRRNVTAAPDPKDIVRTTYDDRTNTLMLTADASKLNMAMEMVNRLDTSDAPAAGDMRIFQLKNSSADDMRTMIAEMLGIQLNTSRVVRRGRTTAASADTDDDVKIVADTQSNRLIVSAPAEQMAKIDKLIKELDTKSSEASSVKVVPLQAADAAQIAAILQQSTGKADARGRMTSTLSISSDPRTNTVIMTGPANEINKAMKLIEQLDTKSPDNETEVRVIHLTSGDASTLAASLLNILNEQRSGSTNFNRRDRRGLSLNMGSSSAGQIKIEADSASNSLIISAPTSDWPRIESLLDQLKAAAAPTESVTRIIPLKYADAEELAQTLSSLLNGQGGSSALNRFSRNMRNRNRFTPITSSSGDITIAASSQANALLVTASPEDQAKVAELVAQLDIEDAGQADPISMIQLEVADAASVAQTLEAMLPPVQRGQISEVSITADTRTNSVLVRAPASQRKMIEEMISRLDSADNRSAREMRVVQLKHVLASDVVPMIEQLYGDGASSSASRAFSMFNNRRNSRSSMPTLSSTDQSVKVTAAPNDTALVIEAPADKMEAVIALIDSIDTADSQQEVLLPRSYSLVNADASELAASLANLFSEQGQSFSNNRNRRNTRYAPSLNTSSATQKSQPRFEAITKTNTLLVRATVEQYEIIDQYIKEVEAGAKLTEDTRIFKLKYANADNLVETLQTMLTGQANSAMNFNPWSRNRRNTNSSSTTEVRIAAQSQLNSIIVQGPPDKLELAETLISQFDVPDNNGQTVTKIVPLQNAKADTLAESVNAAISGESTGNSRMRFNWGGNNSSSSDADKVSVVAETNSNSLIVRGPLDKVDEVIELIRKLDTTGTSNTPKMRRYMLKNNDATELAETLGELFNNIIAQSQSSGGSISRNRRWAGSSSSNSTSFTITADQRTNSLIVSTTEAYFVMFEQLLNELEQTEVAEREVHYIQLVNADAYDLADQLDAMFMDRKGPDAPVIEVDYFSNSLTIIAKDIDYRRMEPIIRNIDSVTTAQVRVISAGALRAGQLAEQLKRVYPQISDNKLQIVDELPEAEKSDPAGQGAKTATDVATDAPDTDTAAEPVRQPVMVAVDSYSNSLIISGSRQDLDSIEDLITQLSEGFNDAEEDVRWFKIEQADVEWVASMLKQLFSTTQTVPNRTANNNRSTNRNTGNAGRDLPDDPTGEPSGNGNSRDDRQQRTATRTVTQSSITAVADTRTNHVIVRAKPTEFELVERLIDQLDKPGEDASSVFLLQLNRANAAEMAGIITDLYAQMAKTGSSEDQTESLAVSSDERANVLILSCSPKQFEKVKLWVEQVEQMNPQRGTPRIIEIKNADPEEVGEAIENLFGSDSTGSTSTTGKRGGKGGAPSLSTGKSGSSSLPFELSVLASQRQLLVVAEDEDFEAVRELVEKLDQAAAEAKPEVKIFELKFADNNKVAESLTEVFKKIARDGHDEDSVTITALKNTNAVMVAGTAERIAEAERIITQLDNETVSPELEFRVYQLNHAKPSNIKDLLEKLLAEYQKSRPDEQVAITADDTTRSIIVTARGKVFEQVEKILAAIDIEPKVAVTEVRIVPLKRADAKTLADVLNEMLRPSEEGQVTTEALVLQEQVKRLRIAQGAIGEDQQLPELDLTRPIKISSDPSDGGSAGSNSLIVSSTPENVAALVAVIEMMDAVPLAEEATIEIFQLQHADAEVVGELLEEIFTEGADTLSGIENAGVKGRARPENVKGSALVRGVNISADIRTNSLVVSGSVESVALAKDVIARLDVDGDAVALSGRVRILPLKYANAGTIAETFSELFTKRYENARTEQLKRSAPVILPDLRSNSLLIVASQDDHGIIDELLTQLDARQLDPSVKLVVIPLKHNDAGVVGPMLKEIFDARLESMTPSGQESSPQDRVDIATDALINGLIISASRENLDLINELLAKVDIEPAAVTGVVRMYPMKNADAQRIAEMLKSLVDDGLYKPGMAAAESSDALANREKVSMVADTRTNVLVVSASRENFAVIEEIIARLDSSDDYSVMGDIRLYTLKRADATELAETLDSFFESKRSAEDDITESSRSLKVTIVADARTNTLLVAGGRECFADVEAMLEKLDGERGLTGSAPKVFTLKKAKAEDIAEIIKALYESQGGTEQANVSVEADARTNSIVVTGDQADLDRIEALLENLDSDKVTLVTQVRVFPLKRAKAEELSELLKETLTKQLESPTSEGDQKQAILQHIRTLSGGGRLVSRALQEGLLVVPDNRSNSLVVAAPIDTMPLLENIIGDLDSVESPKAQIKIITLVNSDAEKMGETLKGIFRLEETSLEDASMATYQLVGSEAGPSVTMGSAEDAILTVTVDLRTNSLVIGGSETYIAMAESVVKQLDGKVGHKRVTRIYRLHNARASDIEEAVVKWLDNERTLLTDRLGEDALGSGSTQLEDEVTVVAVNNTSDVGEETQTSNTLLISASPRYMDTILEMIEQLDEPQPQVQIDVMLAEVKLDDSMEFGVDWQYLTSIDNAKRNISSYGLMGTLGNVSQLDSGLSMAVTGGDLQVFFQALHSEGKLEVVARPHLTVIDNQEGIINIGERVPFITDIRTTDSATYNTVQYEDIGVILTVTPRISPDGFVRMSVAPEISSFASTSVQISDGVSSPIFNSRKVETSVSVKDGHTVVIGGLIRTQEDTRETKIPLLGDIPLLGKLFRRQVDSTERTELLMVLTPRIINNIDTSDKISRDEASRISLSNEHVEKLYSEKDRNIRNWDKPVSKKDAEKQSQKPVKDTKSDDATQQFIPPAKDDKVQESKDAA